MKVFNINDTVNVKLTEEGLRILELQHNELLKEMSPEAAKTVGDFKAPNVDEEGYSQIPLWELMKSFGRYMYDGNPNPPFETTIAISDEYLVEQTNEKGRSF